MRVYIMDEIVAKPGQSAAVRKLYRSEYIPAAQRRGMVLQGQWQSPAGEDLAEILTRLFWIWLVDGVPGWWKQRFSRSSDGSDERFEKHAFWAEMERLIQSRHRYMLSDQLADEEPDGA